MTTAANRFQRIALMLPRFVHQERQSIAELSTALGVPADTIVADLSALIERLDDVAGFDDPITVTIEGDTVSLRTDHFHRPMRVTGSELCALELGLGLITRESSAEREAVIAGVRQKLLKCITGLPHDSAYAGLRDGTLAHPELGRILEESRTALARSRVVQIDYHRPDHVDAESRTVRPYALFFHHGAWYLAGYCERAKGLRLFRADRIRECRLTDVRFDAPTDFSIKQLMVDGRPLTPGGTSTRFRIWYSAAIARWIAERDGQPLESDGSAIRELPLADREWAIRHVLQYGPDARVIEPAELREAVRERLERMQRRG